MKTIIYVDGYNLFYGCLKHTPYKWLDLYKLFSNYILKAQSPHSSVEIIKYFTAPIKAKVATHGQEAQKAQDTYHRALEKLYPEKIEIIKGYYSLERANLLRHRQPPDKSDRVAVWRLEEKQTDVNIVLQVYRDVLQEVCEQIVIVSNDTDLEPVLQIVRDDFGNRVDVGVVIPVPKPEKGRHRRPANARLSKYCDWTRHYILGDELEGSQLPNPIPTRKKPIIRPDYW